MQTVIQTLLRLVVKWAVAHPETLNAFIEAHMGDLVALIEKEVQTVLSDVVKQVGA